MKTWMIQNPYGTVIILGFIAIAIYFLFFRKPKNGIRISENESPNPNIIQNPTVSNSTGRMVGSLPSQTLSPAMPSGGRVSSPGGAKH